MSYMNMGVFNRNVTLLPAAQTKEQIQQRAHIESKISKELDELKNKFCPESTEQQATVNLDQTTFLSVKKILNSQDFEASTYSPQATTPEQDQKNQELMQKFNNSIKEIIQQKIKETPTSYQEIFALYTQIVKQTLTEVSSLTFHEGRYQYAMDKVRTFFSHLIPEIALLALQNEFQQVVEVIDSPSIDEKDKTKQILQHIETIKKVQDLLETNATNSEEAVLKAFKSNAEQSLKQLKVTLTTLSKNNNDPRLVTKQFLNELTVQLKKNNSQEMTKLQALQTDGSKIKDELETLAQKLSETKALMTNAAQADRMADLKPLFKQFSNLEDQKKKEQARQKKFIEKANAKMGENNETITEVLESLKEKISDEASKPQQILQENISTQHKTAIATKGCEINDLIQIINNNLLPLFKDESKIELTKTLEKTWKLDPTESMRVLWTVTRKNLQTGALLITPLLKELNTNEDMDTSLMQAITDFGEKLKTAQQQQEESIREEQQKLEQLKTNYCQTNRKDWLSTITTMAVYSGSVALPFLGQQWAPAYLSSLITDASVLTTVPVPILSAAIGLLVAKGIMSYSSRKTVASNEDQKKLLLTQVGQSEQEIKAREEEWKTIKKEQSDLSLSPQSSFSLKPATAKAILQAWQNGKLGLYSRDNIATDDKFQTLKWFFFSIYNMIQNLKCDIPFMKKSLFDDKKINVLSTNT